jgi:tetratricopeptide (TPR) repeat protein
MRIFRRVAALCAFLALGPASRAGLYYSGEQIAELPSQWRGFVLDQRALRNVAAKASGTTPSSPLRSRYQEALSKLEKAGRERKLSADESADLGALYIRMGEPAKAVELLRRAQRDHPNHFRITANLGTAWQLQGDLSQAAGCLQQAVRLAPGKLQKAEEYQLKLVRLRQRQPRGAQDLDDLFGVRFVGEAGTFEPGKLAADERKKLPSDAAALAQQLALWLPADGRLLWQLAELANAHGDIRTAAAIMDGCVTEFGLHAPELRRHRQLLRDAADHLAKESQPGGGAKATHEQHAGVFRPHSSRPLMNKLDTAHLPPVHVTGVNALPWTVLAETIVDRQFKPTFPNYLRELDGKQVSLAGFMQPLGEELELGSFMLVEYPVGCWYCEMPEITGIVLIELPVSKTATYTRGQIKITGRLSLNASDPENFLYTVKDAKISGVD